MKENLQTRILFDNAQIKVLVRGKDFGIGDNMIPIILAHPDTHPLDLESTQEAQDENDRQTNAARAFVEEHQDFFNKCNMICHRLIADESSPVRHHEVHCTTEPPPSVTFFVDGVSVAIFNAYDFIKAGSSCRCSPLQMTDTGKRILGFEQAITKLFNQAFPF